MLARVCSVILLSVLSAQAFAADPPIYSHKSKGAIDGADTVAYWSLQPGDAAVYGSDEFTYEHQGATWKFVSAANRDAFAADPQKYMPEFGGYCAFAASHNFTKPIDPNRWKIVDGKLYLNFNRIAHRKWLKDEADAIVRGHANWPNLLKECEKHNNCRKI